MSTTDLERLRLIAKAGHDLARYIERYGVTRESVCNDQVTQWTVTTPLYNIGENVYRLSDELKQENPDIPWFRIAGMRHRLVHDYQGTNWSIVASTVFEDVPEFISQVDRLLASQ